MIQNKIIGKYNDLQIAKYIHKLNCKEIKRVQNQDKSRINLEF